MDIASARLYLCTDARRDRGDFADFVDAAFAGGVDIIQVRDKTIDVAHELDALDELRAVAERHGKLWAVNDRADVAATAGAPVLHLGQRDLPTAAARRLSDAALGLSTNTLSEVNAALANPDLAYFCTGPVWATPTKPGRSASGLGVVSYASARAGEKPWFAIGGIDLSTVAEVVDAGASRIVVVRAITEADDPASAARALRDALPPL